MRASIIVGGVLLGLHCMLAHAACPERTNTELKIGASSICVVIDDATLIKHQAMLRAWIDRSAHIVAAYYAMFPAPLVVIRLQGMDGDGVGGGRTINDSGLKIGMRVGREATAQSLAGD